MPESLCHIGWLPCVSVPWFCAGNGCAACHSVVDNLMFLYVAHAFSMTQPSRIMLESYDVELYVSVTLTLQAWPYMALWTTTTTTTKTQTPRPKRERGQWPRPLPPLSRLQSRRLLARHRRRQQLLQRHPLFPRSQQPSQHLHHPLAHGNPRLLPLLPYPHPLRLHLLPLSPHSLLFLHPLRRRRCPLLPSRHHLLP